MIIPDRTRLVRCSESKASPTLVALASAWTSPTWYFIKASWQSTIRIADHHHSPYQLVLEFSFPRPIFRNPHCSRRSSRPSHVQRPFVPPLDPRWRWGSLHNKFSPSGMDIWRLRALLSGSQIFYSCWRVLGVGGSGVST